MSREHWIRELTPVERQSSQDIEAVVNSWEWCLYAGSGLMAIMLFMVAASRSRQGDAVGALFSSLGAVLSATAPIIAKSFSME